MKEWIKDHFGSSRGLIRYCWFEFLNRIGRYQTYRKIDWQSVDRLVFVCKGNICRSAFAEAVSRSRGCVSVSCGIDTVVGAPADETAIKVAEKIGIDLHGHRTTSVHSLSIRKNDLLIAMEPWQLKYMKREFGSTNACTLLGLWGAYSNPYIHDPFSATNAYYKKCFSAIEESVVEVVRKANQ